LDDFEDHDLPVDFPTVADFHNEHHQSLVLDITDDAVIADLVAPIPTERMTLSQLARVLMRCKAFRKFLMRLRMTGSRPLACF
jgi:hypothetical protein